MRNCVDIVRPFVAEMAEQHPDLSYQVIGGTGSAALALAETLVLPRDVLVAAPENLFVPQFRDKKQRNKRDLDLLVLSSHEPTREAVETTARETIHRDLKLSVFGLKSAAALRHAHEHPILPDVFSWVSDRYVEESGGTVTELWKGLYPFAVPVDTETLETWYLQVGKQAVLTPIPHPGATLLNYLTRSVSGIRPKDMEKLLGTKDQQGIAETVLQTPGMKEWLFDGPGKNLVHLARVLHGLRQPYDNQQPLVLTDRISLTPVHPKTLPFDPAFMFATESAELGFGPANHLSVARAKSRVVHAYEKNEKLVAVWQQFVEPLIGKVLHNN